MKTYTAFFFTDANYASAEIEADTPEQALALARAMNDNDEVEHFHHYDQASPVNHVEILDAISRGYGRRADGDILARICAHAGLLPQSVVKPAATFIRAALLAGPRLASFLDQEPKDRERGHGVDPPRADRASGSGYPSALSRLLRRFERRSAQVHGREMP